MTFAISEKDFGWRLSKQILEFAEFIASKFFGAVISNLGGQRQFKPNWPQIIMKIIIFYYPISILSFQILFIFPLFVESIKDLDGEINVIELVENSKDPYIVFNEKKKGGFTREELETHFQTLSDMIKSDETVAKSRKKAAIKKLEKMRDELAKVAKDIDFEIGPTAEETVPTEDNEPENNGPLADSENAGKKEDHKEEESKESEGEEANNGPNENDQQQAPPADEEEENENANEEKGPKEEEEKANANTKNEEKDEEEEKDTEDGPSVNPTAENDAAEGHVGPPEKSKENSGEDEEENDEKKEVKSKEEDEEGKEEENVPEEGSSEDGPNEGKKKDDGTDEEKEKIGPKPKKEGGHKPNIVEASEPEDEKPQPPKSPEKDADESGPSEDPEYSEEESGPNEEEKTATMKPKRRKNRRRRPKGDIALNCRRHIHQCFQEEYRKGMAIYCKGTCGQLGKRNVDIGKNCRELAWEGLCSDGMWGDKMDKYCHRSCTRLRG